MNINEQMLEAVRQAGFNVTSFGHDVLIEIPGDRLSDFQIATLDFGSDPSARQLTIEPIELAHLRQEEWLVFNPDVNNDNYQLVFPGDLLLALDVDGITRIDARDWVEANQGFLQLESAIEVLENRGFRLMDGETVYQLEAAQA